MVGTASAHPNEEQPTSSQDQPLSQPNPTHRSVLRLDKRSQGRIGCAGREVVARKQAAGYSSSPDVIPERE
jgi:hypothetical protein